MSTYSTNLALELIGTGEQAGVWGTTTNTNLGTLIEQAISGYVTQAVSTGTDTTITIPNGSSGVARNMYIELTGTGGASTNLIVPANKKLYFIFNNSTGAVTVKVSGQTGVSVPTGKKMVLVSNGTDIVNGLNYIADFASNSATITHLSATSATITNLTLTSLVISNLSIASANITTLTGSTQTLSGNLTLSGGTANGVLYLNGSKVATSGTALVFDGTTLTSQAGVTSGVGGGGKYTIAYTTANANSRSWRIINDVNAYGDFAIQQSTTQAGSTYADIVSINSSGNLGIGTASPGAKLDVNGAIYSQTGGVYTNTLTAYSGSSISVNAGSSNFNVVVNGSERMRLDSSGNLGIGTASPSYRLTVSGGATSLAVNQYLRFGAGLFASSDGSVDNYLFTGSTALRWRNSADNTELMQLTNTGNLGIGTASPARKLDVNGTIRVADGQSVEWGGTTLSIAGSSNTFQFFTSSAERMRLDSSGNLGIGTASPAQRLHVVSPDNLEATAIGLFVAQNGTQSVRIGYNLVYQTANQPLLFGTNDTERARITSGGDLLVGVTSGSSHIIKKAVSVGSAVLEVVGNNLGAVIYNADGGTPNAGNAVLKVWSVGATGRSINAAGTINASGADYAEYMTKASDFVIAKGDVCGIDANGKLTNVYADAISFVVKSTNPSYVGNDGWGGNYENDAEGLETARQKVDRIAFAGQVPVNVLGATPGQYIVPINDNGAIKGVAVSNPTFEQYQSAVGKVIAVQDDGRALIIVKVA